MRETDINVLEYMKLYEESWGELMTQQHHHNATGSILTYLTISFNELQKKNQDAANLLILCAFLDNQDIWYELFTPALDSDLTKELPDWLYRCVGNQLEFEKCTRFLTRSSFVTANIEPLSFSVHSVLQRWCFHNSDKREIAWLAIIIVASAVPTESDVDYTLLQRRLLPRLNHVYSFLQQNIPQNKSISLELSLINAVFGSRQDSRG